jgi:hypothetical protein
MVRLFSQIQNASYPEEPLAPIEVTEEEEHLTNELDEDDDDVSPSSGSDEDEDLLAEVDEEIKMDLQEISAFNFTNTVDNQSEELCETTELNFEREYDETRGDRVESLEIKLGTNVLPRISCAAHKANISVRGAIKSHSQFSNILSTLSKFCATSHRAIQKANFHNAAKSRLRCDNKTRWNSSFLMLISVMKAYEKDVFNNNYKCPYSLATIEKYVQVLLPAYKFSLFVQRNDSPIGEVIPALLIMFEELKNLKINGIPISGNIAKLRDQLLNAFKKKFQYELESNIYLVSSLLMVSKLNIWYKRSFSKDYVKKAIDALIDVVLLMKPLVLKKRDNENRELVTPISASPSLFSQFSQIQSESEEESASNFTFSYTNSIIKEKESLIRLLDETNLKAILSTKKFWISNSKCFPILSSVALILINIPSNSAFIERFFSLCGIICHDKAGNMGDELIIKRSMIAANIKILD